MGRAVESDQTQAVLSSDPLAIFIESGDTSTARTLSWCPLNSVTFLLSSAFHTCTRPPLVPLTIHFPSRDTAMLKTRSPASIGLPASMPSSTRHRRTFRSTLPLTTCFPSTRNTTESTLPRPSISMVFAEEGWTSLDSRLLVSIPFIVSPGTHHSLIASRFLQTFSIRESERW